MEDSQISEIVKMINFATERLLAAKDDLVTYEEDQDADHQDGQYAGRVTAYREMIWFCADRLSKMN